MPELSRFFGIIIRMFSEPAGSHHEAHFHVYYQEHVAIYSITSIELIAGSLPLKQKRLAEAWAELHQYELLEAWNHLQQGQLPNKIDPLK